MAIRNVFVDVPSVTNDQVCVWNGAAMEGFTGAAEFGEIYIKLPGSKIYVRSNFIGCNRAEAVRDVLTVLALPYVNDSDHDHLKQLAGDVKNNIKAYRSILSEDVIEDCRKWIKDTEEKFPEIIEAGRRCLASNSIDQVILVLRGFLKKRAMRHDYTITANVDYTPHTTAAIIRIVNTDAY